MEDGYRWRLPQRQQDLGDEVFECDPRSLQQILGNREMSPKIEFKSTLVPAKSIPTSLKKLGDQMEFFESRSGALFWRKRVGAGHEGLFAGGSSVKRRLGFGRTEVKGLVPKQLQLGPVATGSSSGKKRLGLGRTDLKGLMPRRLHAGAVADTPGIGIAPKAATAFKPPHFHPAVHRQSISERKAVPMIDNSLRSFLPRPTRAGKARKQLDFERKDFDFVKPKEPTKKSEHQSLAKMIMMRESLAGMPRASLTGLLRQGLTMAELDRMFEDDSTESFENLESRLKTPATIKKRSPHGVSSIPKFAVWSPEGAAPQEGGVDDGSAYLEREAKVGSGSADALSKGQAEGIPVEKSEVENLESRLITPAKRRHVTEDDDDCKETENPLLQANRCRSLDDVTALSPDDQVVVLATSNSEEDLTFKRRKPLDLSSSDPFLKEAIESLDRHRSEQAVLESKLLELMDRSRKRRKEFKAVWGVSPMSINQKRTVKTALNVQTVKFSDGVEESASLQASADTDDDDDYEGDELNVSISAELFEKYIEANFSPHPESKLHNFSGINTGPNNGLSLEEIAESLNADEFLDNLDQVDMEIEDEGRENKVRTRKSVRFQQSTATCEEPSNAGDAAAAAPMVQIDIPVRLGDRSQGNISLNESRACFSGGLLNTPRHQQQAQANFTGMTPMALRDISNRAQRELASLYFPIDDDDTE